MNLPRRIAPDRRHSPQRGPAPAPVCHLPPGTGKWDKIERRLFSTSQNWRGKPLASRQVIVDPAAAAATGSGLHARAEHAGPAIFEM